MASTIQLTSPVLFGANEFTSSGSSSLIPLTAMSTTDSTLYPQATFLTKDLVSEIATTGSPYGGAPIDCLSNNYFLAPPGDAILYTSTAALQPQILSINDKVRIFLSYFILYQYLPTQKQETGLLIVNAN